MASNPMSLETDYLVVGAGAVGREPPETPDPDRLVDLQGRFLTSVFPALAKLQELAAEATPVERELWFEPA